MTPATHSDALMLFDVFNLSIDRVGGIEADQRENIWIGVALVARDLAAFLHREWTTPRSGDGFCRIGTQRYQNAPDLARKAIEDYHAALARVRTRNRK